MMKATRKSSVCALCDNCNLASICCVCVNYRLNEYSSNMKLLKNKRDALYSKLTQVLLSKGKADDQNNWRVLHNEKLGRLRDKLRHRKEKVSTGKAKMEKMSQDLNIKYEILEATINTLKKNRVEQIEKYFPNLICTQNLGHMAITSERIQKQSVIIKQICKLFPQRRVNMEGEIKDGYSGEYDTICNSRLPRGLDPHSVPSDELSASLGHMVQLLNLIVHNVCVPALHNSGFAGSCSRIWQRDSYWDAHPSSRCEYQLFLPRQNLCTTDGETSWSEKSSSNFSVTLMESVKKTHLEPSSGSLNYSPASPQSIALHKDLQKGISLLKKSVACITAHCYNSLSLEVPKAASTFEAFSRLLATLSSNKEVRAVLSLRTIPPRPSKQGKSLNQSVWNVETPISSSTLIESAHGLPLEIMAYDNYLPSCATSSLYANEFFDMGKKENLIEGWDFIEHPILPPPSQTEDVEHWTRAMFIDAKKK